MSDQQKFDGQQLLISQELLMLIQWLVENEQPALRQLIVKALNHGLKDEIRPEKGNMRKQDPQELQGSILDFFVVLEALTHNAIHEGTDQEIMYTQMIPALKHLDISSYDHTTINSGISKASAATRAGKDSKEALCKEILKRWKPLKKSAAH